MRWESVGGLAVGILAAAGTLASAAPAGAVGVGRPTFEARRCVDDGFAGVFKGGVITLELREDGASVQGTLRLRSAAFAVRGTVVDGVLKGQYESGGQWIPFVATLESGSLTLESGGTMHSLAREPATVDNPLSDPSLSQPGAGAPSGDVYPVGAEDAWEVPNLAQPQPGTASPAPFRQYTDPRGLVVEIPDRWLAHDAGTLTTLMPPVDPTSGQPAFFCNLSIGPWEGAVGADDSAALDELASTIVGALPQARQEGRAERLGPKAADGLRISFTSLSPNGTRAPFHAYAKLRARSLLLMLLFGNQPTIDAADATIRQVFRSAEPGRPAVASGGVAPVLDPVLLVRYPQVFTHGSGLTIRYPNEWTAQDEGVRVTFFPPYSTNAPDLTIQADAQPWTAPVPVTAPEAMDDLGRQFAAAMQGFVPDGPAEVLAGSGGARFRFQQSAAGDAGMRVTIFVKSAAGKLITVAVVGHAPTVLSVEPIAAEMFLTAEPSLGAGGAAHDQAAGLTQVLETPGSGYVIRYPAGWLAQGSGTSAMIVAPPGEQPVEMYSLVSMPWIGTTSIDDPVSADQAATMFTQAMPGLQREGPIESLGPGGGVLMRYAGIAPDGQPYKMRLLARSGEQAAVFMMFLSDIASVVERERIARDMIQSVEFGGSPMASPAPQGMGGIPSPPAPAMQAAPVQTPAAQLDWRLIGQWSSTSAMSSPAPWGDLGQGGTSFVMETIYVFAADGTFMLGSRAAGGNNNWGGDTGFAVSAAGRWSAAASPQGNYILLQYQTGQTGSIRYVFHEGQLVLGERGSRSFWSPLR